MARARIASSIRHFSNGTEGSLTSGAVHIRVFPRPRNLAESREILKALEKYGEISMYKHLKYEPVAPAPNAILAIYRSPLSSQKLINASPLRLRLELKDSGWKYNSIEGTDERKETATEGQSVPSQEREGSVQEWSKQVDGMTTTSSAKKGVDHPKNSELQGPEDKQWATWNRSLERAEQPKPPSLFSRFAPELSQAARPSSLTTPPTGIKTKPVDKKNAYGRSISTEYREFEIKISPSYMNHQAYIERQWYYGQFVPNKQTIMAQDLMGRVPLEGMIDCDIGKGELPLRIRKKRDESGGFMTFSLKAFYEETMEKANHEAQ